MHEVVSLNLSSSGILAQQIIAGAPAHIYVSANVRWMDEVVRSGLAGRQDVREFARNRLVVIVDRGSNLEVSSLHDLRSESFSRIAIGDPTHAPVGIYAKEALENAGVWDDVSKKTIPAIDTVAALAYVERGEAETGIVYFTDARLRKGVRVAYEIPAALHDPVVYEAVALGGSGGPSGRRLLDFICGVTGRKVITGFGFEPPAE